MRWFYAGRRWTLVRRHSFEQIRADVDEWRRLARERAGAIDELTRQRDRALALLEHSQQNGERFAALAEEALKDSRTERQRIDELIDKLADSQRQALDHVRSLADGFGRQLAELRREGFNPIPPGTFGAEYQRQAAEEQAPERAPEPEQTTGDGSWGRCVEAAQERAGDDVQLYNSIMRRAVVWRDNKVPFREIETRILNGDG